MRNRTARDLMVVFAGRAGFVALSFLATSLVLRRLSAADAGVYWLALATVKVVTGCLGDSLDFAVLRSVPGNLLVNRRQALDTLRAAFWMRIGVALLLGAAGAALARPLSQLLFKRPDYGVFVVLTATALAGEMLARSAMNYFQASERFRALVATEIVVQGFRITAVAALLVADRLNLTGALVGYLAAPYAGFLMTLALLPAEVFRLAAPSRSELLAVYRYTRWMVLVMALAALYERFDVMLLAVFRGPAEVGMYAPAVMLASTPELLVAVVLTVVNPRVSHAYESNRFPQLARAYLRWALPVAAIALAGALAIGGPVIVTIFGARYAPAVAAFKILATGTLLFAAVTPLFSSLLSLAAPRRALVVTVSALLLVSAGGAAVMPRYGAVGTAVLMTSVRLLLAALIVVLARGLLKRGKRGIQPLASRGRLPGDGVCADKTL